MKWYVTFVQYASRMLKKVQKSLVVNYNKGIGGIEGCNETSIRWFLLVSTVPLFLVVCVLPAVQDANVRTALGSDFVPFEKPSTLSSYQYGTEIVKALSFRNVIFSQRSINCKHKRRRKADSKIFAVRVIGERHSGAPWLLRQLSRQVGLCFVFFAVESSHR